MYFLQYLSRIALRACEAFVRLRKLKFILADNFKADVGFNFASALGMMGEILQIQEEKKK